MLLGFSTGAIFQKVPSISQEIVDICCGIGCNAIELNANRLEEVDLLEGFMNSGGHLSGFEYISMHSPGINVFYKKDRATLSLLKKLEKAYRHFGCKHLVVHPSLVEDWGVFENFSFNLAVENMSLDNPAPFFLPEHLESVFEKDRDYEMTFDVKHAFESSAERKNLPEEIWQQYKKIIVELHISGYNPQATKHEHKPLATTKQTEIVNFVKDKQHLPIIIESNCESVEQMKEEYEYIKNLLTK
ncbi:MAG: hypothetical protein WC831_04490 [Parcubacteria group bacterium]